VAGVGVLAATSGTGAVNSETALSPEREPTYRRWLPAAETFRDDPGEYFVRYVDAAELRVHGSRIPSAASRAVAGAWGPTDHVGVPPESVDEAIHVGLFLGGVVLGSFDASDVVETVLDAGYERDGEYAGYERVVGSLGQRAAVRDGVVVWASEHLSSRFVEATIDARNGDTTRYHEASDAFAALTERVGRPTVLTTAAGDRAITDGEHTNATGYAILGRLDGDDTHGTQLLQFPDADAAGKVDRTAFGRGSADYPFAPPRATLRRSGRYARLDATVDTASFADWAVDRSAPAVTWVVDHAPESDAATVEHVAGDAVDAESLTVETLRGETDRQFVDEYDRVEPGDAVTVAFDAAADDHLGIRVEAESVVYTRRFEPS